MAIVVGGLAYTRPGGGLLFTDVGFRVGDRDHAGLVGANGVGKSTLLRLLAGELRPDAGTMQVDGRLGYMPQHIGRMEPHTTVRELLLDASPPPLRAAGLELLAAEVASSADPSADAGLRLADAVAHWGEAGGYEIEALWDECCARVLRQPFEDAANRPVAELSGGEQKRLVLEVLFNSDVPVLLLDEPDNYLDLAGKRWLEAKLNASDKTILLVSHDRFLLGAATNRIVTLEGEGAWVHGGSFEGYEAAREARQEKLGEDLGRWKEEERRLFQHFKTMKQRAAISDGNAAQAQAAENRWKRFVEAGPPPAPVRDGHVRLRLRGSESGRKVLDLRALAIPGILSPFSTEVRFGERTAVTGPNGSGKSHLLRLLGGQEVACEGVFTLGARVVPGLFSQTHQHPEWYGSELLEILGREGLHQQAAMSALARYRLQFAGQQTFETLSGGQQARFQVLLLELQGANLLLLDEPTDNLDLDSAEALQEALAGFTGTVLAVTHDRWFLRSFDRFLYCDYEGDVYEFPDLAGLLPVLAGERSAGSAAAARPLSVGTAQRTVH